MTGPETLLAIETSCDEASVAVLRNAELLSLTVLSQDVHEIFGGVVPELASRAHLKVIDRVVETALDGAAISIEGVDSVAVTAGPGLLGSLLVGVCYAKGIALAADLNLIGVNHLEGHLFAPKLESPELDPPFVALLVSGGHTMLLDVRAWGDYTLLGQTRDDAVGEAFDKVATLLGLGYPGGPEIERLAAEGEPRFDLPRPMLRDGFDFSFSGLKTAVLYTAKKSNDLTRDRADIAASFQAAAFDVLSHKARMALQHTGYETLVLAGGVACSATLTKQVRAELPDCDVFVASARLNADNAAMIGRAGWFHLERGEHDSLDLDADARMPWPGLQYPTN